MPYVLKAGMVLHLRVQHGELGIGRGRASMFVCLLAALVIVIVVSSAALVREIRRSFMLMCIAIVLEAADDLVDVGRRVLVQLLVVPEDDDGDIHGAEDGELVRLLEQAALALEEGDRTTLGISRSARMNEGVVGLARTGCDRRVSA